MAGDSGEGAKLQLYNTAARTKEPLRPLSGKRIAFYSCGPTVYDHAHIGNFRAFLTYDVLKRWLTYRGFEVDHVCNLTDIDDKIIRRMARDGVGLRELTDRYAALFFEDLAALNVVPARAYPRATDHVAEIVEMVQTLLEKGLAYENNGSIYFRVARHSGYGALANLKFEGMQDGAGEGGGISDLDEYETDKESAKDFALWKAYKPEDGPVFWETALGKGRPGWHIECSAMARKYLGDTIDIHAGGIDLVFPHHENEVAQSEGATGKPFCNCWVHNGFVNVGGEKMSKSKGNFLTLRGALATALDVRAFRYLVVTSQYRTMLNFTPDVLAGAKSAVKRLDKARAALSKALEGGGGEGGDAAAAAAAAAQRAAAAALAQFKGGMDDDLNAPRAAAGLFALIKAIEKEAKAGSLSAAAAHVYSEALDKMDSVLGVFYEPPGYEPEGGQGGEEGGAVEIPPDRAAAKAAKDWSSADAARAAITARGFAIKDVAGGGVEVTRL
ncbi:Cysteinyl-tRNA synthetase [Tribonema minus]|uniref:Cysteine--tRNA ligase n=1 Tax=Tribonema minus TaxID=303371 RepID=A0A835ZDL4_9STRA|nr:Cysteinyl-tRNA synthetase [Tribonema minus]